MNEFEDNINDSSQTKIDVVSIKERISNLQSLPLDQHSNEYETIHQELVRTLAQIDGL
jgi:hypothetical protein